MKSYSAVCELSLAVKMKSPPFILHHRSDGLTGEEIVTEIDGPQRREPGMVLVEPAFGGVSLAILLFGTVLRCDELRHQRYDFGMAGRDHRRRQHGMIRLNIAVGAFAGQTMRATELLRAKELGAIPGDQHSAAQPAKGLPQRRLGQQSFQTLETGGEQRRVRFVEHVANVIVRRNFLDAEQALAIRPALAFLQSPLKGQERSALHEKHRERRKAEIRHGDIAPAPFAGIRKGGANRLQTRQEGWQQLHPYDESFFSPLGNPKNSPPLLLLELLAFLDLLRRRTRP
jgi:hypothetical protein